MRVLLLFSSSELGGAERSLSRMAMATKDVDYQFATLGDDQGYWYLWMRSCGESPLAFGMRRHRDNNIFNFIISVFRLSSYLRHNRFDIVYVCGFRTNLCLRFLRLFLPKFILVSGVRWNPNSSRLLDRCFRIIERFSHRFVDSWVTNSNIAKQTLIQECQIPAVRVAVIYNGLGALPSMSSVANTAMEILTVANFISHRKGHIEYLPVIQNVLTEFPQARFIFVGRDDMQGSVQSAVNKANLSKFIRIVDFQNDVDIYYRRACLFVLPSLQEGYPTTILEAFSYGIPVIAYAIDGIPELINHNEDGIMVPSSDRDAMATAIKKCLADTVLCQYMGGSGSQENRPFLFITTMWQKAYRVIQSIVARATVYQ